MNKKIEKMENIIERLIALSENTLKNFNYYDTKSILEDIKQDYKLINNNVLYYKDMTKEQIEKLLRENRKLQEKIEELYHDDQIENQTSDYNLIFGESRHVEVCDSYNSFYLHVNSIKLVEDIDKDYLYTQEQIDEFEKIQNKYNEYLNTEESEKLYNLENEIEKDLKELAKDIEKTLHTYEEWKSFYNNIEAEELEAYFFDYVAEWYDMQNFYIIDGDFTRLYRNIDECNIF